MSFFKIASKQIYFRNSILRNNMVNRNTASRSVLVRGLLVFTLDVRQVLLVLVHLAAVDGEGQAFEQHGPLLQLSVSVGEQTQGAALSHRHPG